MTVSLHVLFQNSYFSIMCPTDYDIGVGFLSHHFYQTDFVRPVTKIMEEGAQRDKNAFMDALNKAGQVLSLAGMGRKNETHHCDQLKIFFIKRNASSLKLLAACERRHAGYSVMTCRVGSFFLALPSDIRSIGCRVRQF